MRNGYRATLARAGKAVYRKYRFPHPTSAPSGHLLPWEGGSVHASPFPWKGLPSAARRGWLSLLAAEPPPLCLPHRGRGTAPAVDRVLSFILDLRRSPPLFFIPLLPYPPLRGTFPSRGRLCFGNTAFPIQPPPLRGTSFHRKEGVSTRAPSLGRGCRAQRGGVGFLYLRRSRLLFAFPIGEGGPRSGG